MLTKRLRYGAGARGRHGQGILPTSRCFANSLQVFDDDEVRGGLDAYVSPAPPPPTAAASLSPLGEAAPPAAPGAPVKPSTGVAGFLGE